MDNVEQWKTMLPLLLIQTDFSIHSISIINIISNKLEIHYTPKHGSWLNMAEIEFSVLARECLNRRIASIKELEKQVLIWGEQRNRKASKIHWSFTVNAAREKLENQYTNVSQLNKNSNN